MDSLLYFFSYSNIVVLPILLAVLAIAAIAVTVLCVKASRYLDAKRAMLDVDYEYFPEAIDGAVAAAPYSEAYAAPAAVSTASYVALEGISDKDAATIMAIVANKLGASTRQLRFASIRRV